MDSPAKILASFRYLLALRRFLRHPVTAAEAKATLEQLLAQRTTSFLDVLERAVYSRPDSPYRKLLDHAGIEFADVSRFVREDGIEGALQRLYDAGVYITLAEFKGRTPVRRNGLEFGVRPSDFDNPLVQTSYQNRTTGARGVAGSVNLNFDLLDHESAYMPTMFAANDLYHRPVIMRRPEISSTLLWAKMASGPERWFTPSNRRVTGVRDSLYNALTFFGSRIAGRPLPRVEYLPRDQAWRIARLLSEKREAGTPAFFGSQASGAIWVCLAAREKSIDISGTVFNLGGEPYTPAKARIIESVGARALANYAMVEVAWAGHFCTKATALDDYHLMTDKLAAIQGEKLTPSGFNLRSLLYTGLLPFMPKIMINVESGDYGTLERRDCDCPFGQLGFLTHLVSPRSYDKLTSEGVTFLGSDLYTLLEDELPRAFGGGPTDYQLAEEEGDDGLPRVDIVVAPSVGPLDEEALVTTVLQALKRSPTGGARLMADQWQQARTLRVVRREPYATGSLKVLPLHVLQKRDRGA